MISLHINDIEFENQSDFNWLVVYLVYSSGQIIIEKELKEMNSWIKRRNSQCYQSAIRQKKRTPLPKLTDIHNSYGLKDGFADWILNKFKFKFNLKDFFFCIFL